MSEMYNPFSGTTLADRWYLKRKAPTGKVAHLLHPVTFTALCSAPHCNWEWVDEMDRIKTCQKCARMAKR